ncbi:hypothetical protein NFI96_023084 [Prochilodus magdalenae]|nr:hypothetical protein NFI96_023084 [Prochilodus magdalenae]
MSPSGEHSLYYTYTALSKDLTLPGIYEFSALGLLDDREIDYYNSKEQMKVPKQDWMKEKLQPDYWEKGTQSRKSKEQWFKVNLDILMERMRHNKTDLHVLQWRHGCEIDDSNGQVTFLRGSSDYGYDGEDFLSFDIKTMTWIAVVPAALPTKRKWDSVAILNQYTKGYLEKECVDWLTKFLMCREETQEKHSPPEVHVFMKKSIINPDKLTLTCLATGFYPKDVVLRLRRFKTSLPEHLLTSSRVRPNEDGTYQLRKSVEIQEDHTADYDCYVTHSSIQEPVIKGSGNMSDGGSDATSSGTTPSVPASTGISDPKNLRVVETTPTSVKVQWEKPLEEIDRYILLVSPSQTGRLRRQIEVLSGEVSAEVDGLEPGSVYIILLVAQKGSTRSLPATALVTTRISDPKNLRVVETTPTSVKVQWEKPLEEIDRYILLVSPSQTGRLRRQIEVPSGGVSAEVDGLEPGSVYIISLVAEKGSTRSLPATALVTTNAD